MPLAQMNMEAGAANGEADATGQPVQWIYTMATGALPSMPMVDVAAAPPCHMPIQVVMAQGVTDGMAEGPVSAIQTNSTVQAARQRIRGPTVTEQRLKAVLCAEAAPLQKKARKHNKQQQGTEGTAGWPVAKAQPIAAPFLALGVRRGRERANAPMPSAGDAPMQSDLRRRRTTLKEKGAFRRSKVVRELAPAGAAVFQLATQVRKPLLWGLRYVPPRA